MAMNKDRKKGSKSKRRPKSEFDQQLLDLARVTRVVKGGRRFRFRATMVIGNRKGKVGVGVAKGGDVSQAIQKAVADAKKNMITITLNGNTISHEINHKLASAKILLKPTKEGRGVIAGGAVRTVVELVGINDVVAKSYGCSSKLNVARATVEALSLLREPMVDKTKEVVAEKEMSTPKKTSSSTKTKIAADKIKKVVKKTIAKKIVSSIKSTADATKKVAKKSATAKVATDKSSTTKVAANKEKKTATAVK